MCVAPDAVDVAVADHTGGSLGLYFAPLGRVDLDFFDNQRLTKLVAYCCPHTVLRTLLQWSKQWRALQLTAHIAKERTNQTNPFWVVAFGKGYTRKLE